MTYIPEIHHRRSIRLKNYDYSRAAAYFVTICTHNRESLFGDIADGVMVPNDSGKMIEHVWRSLPGRFSEIELDESIIMPNHMHGIVVINTVGALLAAPGMNSPAEAMNQEITNSNTPEKGAASSAPTLGTIIRAFKSISAIAANRILGRQGTPLWQRNYYEHIMRNEVELKRIREYITSNPGNWSTDEYYR